MNKKEFIAALEKNLIRLPKNDRDDILSDYEAHFAMGIEKGKTEEEIASALGDPKELAERYLENVSGVVKGNEYKAPESAQTENIAVPITAQPSYGKSGSKVDAGGVVIVVLLCVFVMIPVLGAIFGIWGSVLGIALSILAIAVPVTILSAALIPTNICLGIGFILLVVASVALSILLIQAAVELVKLTVRLLDWFIKYCKKLATGGNA